MRRFVLDCCSTIDAWPLQVYYSAIIFAPEESIVRKIYSSQFPAWLLLGPRVDQNWDTCLQTQGHSDEVHSVAFSADGHKLASASLKKTVKLWDPATGACTATFEGYSQSLSFDATASYLETDFGNILLAEYPAASVATFRPNSQYYNVKGIGCSGSWMGIR